MGDTRCKHCGERIADCRRPKFAYPEWRHIPWRNEECELSAEPEEVSRG